MRKRDDQENDFRALRIEKVPPSGHDYLEPGHILIPDLTMAIAVVVASSVVVTLFDPHRKQGGLCHFLRPAPPPSHPSTPLYGLPAIHALYAHFKDSPGLRIGIYGGAFPDWADDHQRRLSLENVAIVQDYLAQKNAPITDTNVGGNRGRKIGYVTGTNEILVAKTDSIRRTDWYPALPKDTKNR